MQALCRTETAALGRCPEFTNRAFVLRLPSSLDAGCSTSDCERSSSSSQGPRLLVNLFAAPSPEEPAGPIVAGGFVEKHVKDAVWWLAVCRQIDTQQHASVCWCGPGATSARPQCMLLLSPFHLQLGRLCSQPALLELAVLTAACCCQPAAHCLLQEMIETLPQYP